MGGGGGAIEGVGEAKEDGLRDVGSGGGFFPIGGGGFFVAGGFGLPGTAGAELVGGFGAEPMGGLGADEFDSPGSERYDESRFAPVSIPPPLFFSLGMPPAKRPPSCGAASTLGAAGAEP